VKRRDSQAAADYAARQLGLGEAVFYEAASSHTFTTSEAFLRVVTERDDPHGTLGIAKFVAKSGLGAEVLVDSALEIKVGEVTYFVEAYERLYTVSGAQASVGATGTLLAELHQLVVAELRPVRRLEAVKAAHTGSARDAEFREHFAQAQRAVEQCAGPLVLCHGDATVTNLLITSKGSRWVDLEFSGLGPAAFDVALEVGRALRFSGRAQAREFAEAYIGAGGPANWADVVALGKIMDLLGVSSLFDTEGDHERAHTLRSRLATWAEPFSHTLWKHTAWWSSEE
jgi:aminoglycoside phosphotransferase (APT) family kinase protein